MAYRIPKVHSNQQVESNGLHPIPLVGSKDWYSWLELHHAFCFEADYGSFIVRKEKRPGGFYWYAYHRRLGKLYTAYLGKSDKLTLNHLHEVMLALREKTGQAAHKVHQSSQGVAPLDAWSGDLLMLTKLCIPPIHHQVISRFALLEQLNEGMSRKLTIISATAGSGKTILLSEWATRCQWSVAWISLDQSDNDPTRFWEYFITALYKVQPMLGEQVITLLRSPQAIAMEAILTVLINDISLINQDFALVLDDYDVVQSPEIHQQMLFFLEHLPQHMHLFIVSRLEPPFPLTRLRARRHLLELHTADLRLSDDEIKSFFQRRIHQPLSEEMFTLLASHTEGWITGLELVALSLQKYTDLSAFMYSFANHDSYVFDYLANEVFQQQPEEIQTFLLDTSLLDRLHSSLCDAVTGRNDSQQLLEQLEKANVFLVPLDNQNSLYRYHRMFRGFLLDYLQRSHAHRVDELYRRAYHWYEHAGFVKEAIRYALAAKDFRKATELMEQVGPRMIRQNEVATLLRWLTILPEDMIVASPQLCLLQAWLLIITGQLHLVEKWLHYGQSWLEARPEDEASDSPQQEETRKVRGMLATFRAHIAAFQGNIPSTIAYANLALANLPEDDDFLRSLNALNLGTAYWLDADVIAATQAFTQARKSSQISDNIYVILIALCCLAHMQMAQGRLRQAFKLIQQALQLVNEHNYDLWWVVADIHICAGQLFYEWNDLDNALLYVEKGVALSQQVGYKDMQAYGYTVLAKTKQAQGKREEALRIIEQEGYSFPDQKYQSWIVATMATTHIRLLLMQGDMERVDAWQPSHMCNYVHIFEQLTLVRIYIAKEKLAEASNILNQQITTVTAKNHVAIYIEICLLSSLIHYYQREIDQAVFALEEALALAEPEGYIRLFVSEGLPMTKLLIEVAARSQRENFQPSHPFSLNFVQRLLMACEPLPDGPEQLPGPSSLQDGHIANQLLTKRELEIIRFLVAGLSNREISQEMFISEHTVKWYIKSIYSKMDVHNRAQVVVRAKDLHLWS